MNLVSIMYAWMLFVPVGHLIASLAGAELNTIVSWTGWFISITYPGYTPIQLQDE
ncbi:hypothetical protein GLV98_10825 [Halobacillus litoralis]|uniref:Uncharacterized protein n=1 Tax=Halobacillus litoralis TaxID=45668 RepID=A0A845E569_9BACI|nr:hypothetical protein [Halobacillus litoralis]MYL49982.1 hypothetical protein [Halobacillus litoralis]